MRRSVVPSTGTTIGKRYARTDELGIPFAITVDRDTVDAGSKQGTVTIRERDSTSQVISHLGYLYCSKKAKSQKLNPCVGRLQRANPQWQQQHLARHQHLL